MIDASMAVYCLLALAVSIVLVFFIVKMEVDV